MDCENSLEVLSKIFKKIKNQRKLPHVKTKPQSRKRTFVQTPFPHFTWGEIGVENLQAAKPLLFRSTSCYSLPKITSTIQDKIVKMRSKCEQI